MRAGGREDDAEWARRIGHDSVACRRRARGVVRGVTATLLAAAACAAVGVGLAAATGDEPAPRPIVLAVAVLFSIAVVSAILGVALGSTVVLPQRLRAQGYALRALLPTNPQLRIDALAPHLHRLDDFDRWTRSEGIAPYDPDAAPLERWSWDPRRRRPMLPGRAASWWIHVATILVAAAFFSFAASAAAELLSRGGGAVVPVCVSLAILLLTAAGVARIAAAARTRSEGRAGYTTTVIHARRAVIDARTAVDLVDAASGGLVRAAGALPLTTALYRGRVRALRAASQGTG